MGKVVKVYFHVVAQLAISFYKSEVTIGDWFSWARLRGIL